MKIFITGGQPVYKQCVQQYKCGIQHIFCSAQRQNRVGRKQSIEQQKYDLQTYRSFDFVQKGQCIAENTCHQCHLHNGMDRHARRVRTKYPAAELKKGSQKYRMQKRVMGAVIMCQYLVELAFCIVSEHGRIVSQKDRRPAQQNDQGGEKPHLPWMPFSGHILLNMFYRLSKFFYGVSVLYPCTQLREALKKWCNAGSGEHGQTYYLCQQKGQP